MQDHVLRNHHRPLARHPRPAGPYPCSVEQPAVFMPNKVATGTAQGQDKERKDLKTSLEKLTESIQQLEKRVEAGEKISQSTEAKVKWLEEEMKRRLFWHDLEDKLDRRVKPLEDSLRHLSQRMEELHHQPGTVSPGTASPAFPQPGEAKGEGALSRQLENFQANISKEISSISLRLEQVEEILKEERAERLKLEDRLKLHEEKGHKRDRAPMLPDLPNKDKTEGPKEDKDLPNKDKIDGPKEDKDAPNKDKKEPSKEIDKENIGGIPQISVGQNGGRQANVPGNKALVVVSLPADAKLFLNNQPTRTQGTVRKFLTPTLEPGATFTYVLRAELVHNGQVRVQTQQITFQAGRQANVTFVPAGDTRVAGSR